MGFISTEKFMEERRKHGEKNLLSELDETRMGGRCHFEGKKKGDNVQNGPFKKKKKTKGVILQISRVFGYTRQACPPKKPRKPQDPTAR